MSHVKNENIEILQYLKESVRHTREIAWAQPIEIRAKLLHFADQIADDAAELESQLDEAGYLAAPKNEP